MRNSCRRVLRGAEYATPILGFSRPSHFAKLPTSRHTPWTLQTHCHISKLCYLLVRHHHFVAVVTTCRLGKMGYFTSPTSFRLASPDTVFDRAPTDVFSAFAMKAIRAPHSTHPPFGHLIMLVFEAVLEVVCVSLPGYIIARQGMFDADMQKFVANLNVALFTPCLSAYFR